MAWHKLRAAHDSGARGDNPVLWIVLHSTEGSTAAGAAAWFHNPDSLGSTQVVVDAVDKWRCVPDDVIAWAASGANTNGIHLEFAGFAAWKRFQWLRPSYRKALKNGADVVASWVVKYGIPMKWVKPAGLHNRTKGVVFHYEVSTAFHETTHTDPGRGFPKRTFKRMVRKELRRRRGK